MLELSAASVVASVWVFCELSVVADPDPLHAVRDNAAQRVIIDINDFFVFIIIAPLNNNLDNISVVDCYMLVLEACLCPFGEHGFPIN